MNRRITHIRLTATALTPIHVGDGTTLGLDHYLLTSPLPTGPTYDEYGEEIEAEEAAPVEPMLCRFDPVKAMRRMPLPRRQEFDRLLSEGRLAPALRLLRQFGEKEIVERIAISHASLQELSEAMDNPARRGDVRPFIRSAGQPIIPGSSLKGALRTAWASAQLPPSVPAQGLSHRQAMQDALGIEPGDTATDPFRHLLVSDTSLPEGVTRVDRAEVVAASSRPAGTRGIQMHYERLRSVSDGTGQTAAFTFSIALDGRGPFDRVSLFRTVSDFHWRIWTQEMQRFFGGEREARSWPACCPVHSTGAATCCCASAASVISRASPWTGCVRDRFRRRARRGAKSAAPANGATRGRWCARRAHRSPLAGCCAGSLRKVDVMSWILIASVGGSPDPIVSAIRTVQPSHIVFIASPATSGQAGSAAEVPNILARVQDCGASHAVLEVEPDNPERIFLTLRETIEDLRRRFPRQRLLLDYTGGTKSMTAALFQAAVAYELETQFMGGRRDNLRQVTPGTERALRIPIDWIVAERTEARLRAAWRGFGYAECAAGLEGLLENLGSDENASAGVQRLCDLRDVSRAFDAWDRFRHQDAADGLAALSGRHGTLTEWRGAAARLARDEGARLMDLSHNAGRCAARGRYDDAVARCYRLIEWTAQWHLRREHGIDAGEVDWSRVPDRVLARAKLSEQRGRRTLSGLIQTIQLAAALTEAGPFARFLTAPFPGRMGKTGEGRLKDMLELRNRSILAHGAAPLDEDDWARFKSFMEHFVSVVLSPLLKAAGLSSHAPQLPDDPARLGL